MLHNFALDRNQPNAPFDNDVPNYHQPDNEDDQGPQ